MTNTLFTNFNRSIINNIVEPVINNVIESVFGLFELVSTRLFQMPEVPADLNDREIVDESEIDNEEEVMETGSSDTAVLESSEDENEVSDSCDSESDQQESPFKNPDSLETAKNCLKKSPKRGILKLDNTGLHENIFFEEDKVAFDSIPMVIQFLENVIDKNLKPYQFKKAFEKYPEILKRLEDFISHEKAGLNYQIKLINAIEKLKANLQKEYDLFLQSQTANNQ